MIKIKIRSRIKEASEAPNLSYGVYIHQSGKDFSLYLVDIDSLRQELEDYKKSNNSDIINTEQFFDSLSAKENESYSNFPIIGFIDAKDQNTEKEPCLRALDIAYTAIHEKRSGQGIGKMMYQLALAKASMSGKPLMPDRLHVEPAAENIWNSLSRNDDVIKSFDKNGRPVAGRGNEHSEDIASFFDTENPKKTKMKIDDCSNTNEEPYGVTLNRAYYSDKMLPQLQSYVNNFKSLMQKYSLNQREVNDGLYEITHKIFRRRF